MTNQTGTSPTQRSQRLRDLVAQGKWPPKGHPWTELLLLPPKQVQEWLQAPVGRAFLQGLRNLRDRAKDQLDNVVSKRGDLDAALIYELRSEVEVYDKLLSLPDQINSFMENPDGVAISQEGGNTNGKTR